MVQIFAVISLIISILSFLVGITFLRNRSSNHYRMFLMIMLVCCFYTFFYSLQLLFMGTYLGNTFFILKKAFIPWLGSLSLLFATLGSGYDKLYDRFYTIPIMINIILSLFIIFIPMKAVNVGWPLEYDFEYNLTFMIAIVYVAICGVISGILIEKAARHKTIKFGMNQYSTILLLSLPSFIHLMFSSLYEVRFDVIGINVLIVILFVTLMIIRNNNYRLLPLFKSSTFELVNEGILIVDSNYRIKDFNNALTNIFNKIDFSDACDNTVSNIFKDYPAVLYSLNTLKLETIEIGELFYTIEAHISYKIKNKYIYTLTFKDTTEYIRSLKKLKSLSIIDYLTKLKNKQFFKEVLSMEIGREVRYNIPFSILYVDLDDFSQINEKYGYIAGDHILIRVGNIINREVRKTDLVARCEDDSFLVLLTNTDGQFANIVSERIKKKISEAKFDFEDKIIQVTVSIGEIASENNPERTSNYYIEEAMKKSQK